jgi:hypothetical protein
LAFGSAQGTSWLSEVEASRVAAWGDGFGKRTIHLATSDDKFSIDPEFSWCRLNEQTIA